MDNSEAAAMEAELDAYYHYFMGLEAEAEEEARAAHEAGQAQALDEDACAYDAVCRALAAFLNDDINSHWHPSYRPMIEAGKKALEKAGWKP